MTGKLIYYIEVFMKIIFIEIISLLFFYSSQSYSVSFDCSKAKSFSEQTICSDNKLSVQDDALKHVYEKAKTYFSSQKDLKEVSVSLWKIREECKSKDCIEQWYSTASEFYINIINSNTHQKDDSHDVNDHSNFNSKKTVWTYQRLSGGMSLLTGTFDPKGTGLIFACTSEFISAGALILNSSYIKTNEPPDIIGIDLSTYDNKSVSVGANYSPMSNVISAYISPELNYSISAFNLLDTAKGHLMKIKIYNIPASLNISGEIQTDNAASAILEFKKNCPPLIK
ncbi:lysozyme inhibitor LprI family protein [Salmonella enterica subsp. enterica]